MSSTTPLTSRQQQTLDIIQDWLNVHGYPPTMREIGNRMNIRSTNGVHDHLVALERKGYIELCDSAKSRAIKVLSRIVPGTVCNCAEVQYLRGRVAVLEAQIARIREAV